MIARATLLFMLCTSSLAVAQPGEAENEPAGGALEEEHLQWWPWVISVPLLGMSLAIDRSASADEARWTGRGPIDRGFGSWILDTRRARERADLASDVTLYALFAAPVLDATLWREGESPSRDAYRLLTADTLAFSVQTLAVVATKVGFRRARPFNRGCREDPEFAEDCETEDSYRSFISGHTAAAFTGASLVCAHQRLRGLSPLGRVECVGALLLASVTGALRIASAKHYFADVATSAVIGFLSGFVVPLYVYPRELPRPEPPPSFARMAW